MQMKKKQAKPVREDDVGIEIDSRFLEDRIIISFDEIDIGLTEK